MTTQKQFDQYVAANRSLRRLVVRDLSGWWATLPSYDHAYVRREGIAFMTALVDQYGQMSSTVAMDFYEGIRPSGDFRATLGQSTNRAALRVNTRWALAPLDGPNPDSELALKRMAAVADRMSLQYGRDTLMANSRRDRLRPRWARVPVGKTCAFCLMLASRGAVYRSTDTASRDYHNDCDCQPVPSWDNGADLPPSYDEGELYGLYARAKSEARSDDPKKITAAIRRLDGGSLVNDGVKPRN